ncbi:hypothetical protein BDQ12DRAFT_659019 [Crucibulum laeve]|uniref:Uncharacterized protein n=1 Tax=Crucibulum laeve TaxID=68775 RepID=A0A5C3LV52_9AGAR|nr:hypothetical protein BDQ12DRAFT_659019 [Crucibulum laeve]
MARKKQHRNISGLRNQLKPPLSEPQTEVGHQGTRDIAPPEQDLLPATHMVADDRDADSENKQTHLKSDSPKPYREDSDTSGNKSESGECTVDLTEEWGGLEKEALSEHLMLIAKSCGDDPRDEDWVSDSLRRKRAFKKPRPSSYVKGPDVASKSERTQSRYRNLIKNQRKLDAFGFKGTETSHGCMDVEPATKDGNNPQVDNAVTDPGPVGNVTLETELPNTKVEDSPATLPLEPNNLVQALRDESLTSPPLFSDAPCTSNSSSWKRPAGLDSENEDGPCDERTDFDVSNDGEDNRAEEDIQETLTPKAEVQDWKILRMKITDDLQKKAHLSLTQINQLLILRNFANLRLKGEGCIQASHKIAMQWNEDGSDAHFARHIRALARHYQYFEQLPVEKRGGRK